jgi:TonB-linked SusC/RagA family outer membrane protein
VLDKVTPVEWLNVQQTQKSADTDWWAEVMKPAFQQDHQLTVTLGSDKYRSLLSVNLIDDNGNMVHTYLKKYSVRLNSSYDLLDGKLVVGENFNVISSKTRGDLSGYIQRALLIPSIVPVHDINGGWGGCSREQGMGEFWNPVYQLDATKGNADNAIKAMGTLYANLKLFRGLNLRTQFGVDYSNLYNRHIDPLYKEAGNLNDANNGIYMYTNYATNYTWTNTLNYNLTTLNHNLDVLAGMEIFHYKYEYLNASRTDIMVEDYDYAYINTATGTMAMSGLGDESALISYFGKVNYVFRNKYLLSFTGRFDGSSKFPEANQFGFFPAAQAGWRLSEEPFMSFLPEAISDLKLRVSWGINGNSNIPSNGILSTYKTDYVNTSYMIDGSESGQMPSGYVASHIGNPNLRWESTRQTNFGIDFSILENRFYGSVDWYNKVTDGMLFEPPSNPLLGEGARMWYNAGDMTNNGFELVMTYNSNPQRKFSYSITGNLSFYRNKIDNIPEGLELQYGGNGLDDNILGRPLRSIYGFVADGIFKTQEEVDRAPEQDGKGIGRIRYKDLDGDGTISWLYDQTWIGNYDPDFMYGIEFTSNYKNFDFSMFWQGVAGSDVYNDWLQWDNFVSVTFTTGNNLGAGVLDAWFYDNTDADIPALTWLNANEENRISTYFIQSGSYLKLRNIELGYTLPEAVCRKISMKSLRVFASAQNAISIFKRWGDDAFTGWDAEVSQYTHYWVDDYDYSINYVQNYPRPAIFSLGLNATF